MLTLKKWNTTLPGLLFLLGMLGLFLLITSTESQVASADVAVTNTEMNVVAADVDCAQYPHWECNDPALQYIDDFIKTHKDKGYVAAMDWDGTLYSETIMVKEDDFHPGTTRSGQSVWHLWGAENGYFPAFNTADGDQVGNIVRRDDYLEGKTNVSLSDYSKFSQTATFEVGMTPQEMNEGIEDYLTEYPTKAYAYLKMLDLLQQFANNGFQIWIITGSNPYFIAGLVSDIDETLGYELLATYCEVDNPDLEECHIVGNGAKQSPDGRFTMVYDDRFVRLSDPYDPFFLKRNSVDGAGKVVAIRNYIEAQANQPIVFYAGDSGEDYEAIEYVLDQEDVDTLVVAVNARGTLRDLVAKYEPQGQLIQVSDDAAQP